MGPAHEQRLSAPATTGIAVEREALGRVPGDGVTLAFGFWPGAGQTVVGLHGVTAQHLNFVGIAERLAGRRPLLAFDLRGRGDSDKPDGPYGMEQHARDVAAAMSHFGLGTSVAIGHSMGAYVAIALAATFPERVKGLVLVDGGIPLEPPPGLTPGEMLDTLLSSAMGRLRRTFPSQLAYFDYWHSQPTFRAEDWNRWVEAFYAYDLGGPPPEMRAKAAEEAVRADSTDQLRPGVVAERLQRIRVPILLIRAERGMAPMQPPLISDEMVNRLKGWAPQLEDHLVPGTTHYTIALGEPGATIVADLLVDFAERCGA